MENSIELTLNGRPAASHCRPDTTVLEWLRGEAALRGTKEGCAEGDCGACTILIDRGNGYEAANSCIMLMGQVAGAALMTVEGLAASQTNGHAVQQAMEVNGSSQCGFCTPGIVAALSGLVNRTTEPSEEEIHDALAGNLCRCTGYRPIVEAALKAAKSANSLPKAEIGSPNPVLGAADCIFNAPRSLSEFHKLRAENPAAIVLAGGTDVALDVAQARSRWERAILTREVSELRELRETDETLEIGGAVTWQELLPSLTKHWPSFATLVRRFGSVQIRSMGTIGGNLGTASPIGDGAPALLALDATLVLSGPNGDREIALNEHFLDYRKTSLQKDEIIRSVRISLPKQGDVLRVYKVSKRYDQDISTVCGAFWGRLEGEKIADMRMAFGGMAATPKRCAVAENALLGKTLSEATKGAAQEIENFFTPMTDMRGSQIYRSRVAANLLERFRRELAGETVEVMDL